MNEKENTFRALIDERPLVTSFWCRLRYHQWTAWSKPYNHNGFSIQDRCCSNCNQVEARQIAFITA